MGVRQASQAVREARVLAAARVLFAEKGYEQTSVKDIAARAGVSVGTVANTGDKASLLRSLFNENETVALLGRLAALDAHPATTFADEMLGVFDEWFRSIEDDQDLVRDYCMALLAQGGAGVRTGLDDSVVRAIERRLVVHHPGLDPLVTSTLAFTVYSTTCMLVIGALIGSHPIQETPGRLASVLHTLTDGLS